MPEPRRDETDVPPSRPCCDEALRPAVVWFCEAPPTGTFAQLLGDSQPYKLRVTGFDWWYSGAFERGIADEGTAPALWLAEHHLWLVWTRRLTP